MGINKYVRLSPSEYLDYRKSLMSKRLQGVSFELDKELKSNFIDKAYNGDGISDGRDLRRYPFNYLDKIWKGLTK